MTKKARVVLVVGIAATLAVVAALFAQEVMERKAARAFVAEQVAQLEEDKASLAPASDLGESWAIDQCEKLHKVTADEAKVGSGVSERGVFLYADTEHGMQDVSTCSARWDGTEWVVSLG